MTEMAPPPVWQRHDLVVVAVMLALFVTGALLQRHLAAPHLVGVSHLGLHISRPAGWLPARRVGRPTSGLAARDDGADPATDGRDPADPALPEHLVYQSATDPAVRLELRVSQRPATGNLRSALVLQRVSRHGEAHWADESTDRTIAGRDWIRTQYRYAYKGTKSDSPRIATAIEYAILNGRLLYVVTLHGSSRTAALLESSLVPTLSVDANHPAAVERGR